MTTQHAKTDLGPPDYRSLLPPIIKENYGKWAYHEQLRPGVLRHVSETGAELHSVRIASPRLVSIVFTRDLCDLADQYCGGYLRFTSRNNVEFLVSDKAQLAPLQAELAKRDMVIGGTGKGRLALACGLNMCGAVHCSDIALVGVHRKPPVIDHERVSKMCEVPTLIASCPTAAIPPNPKGKSVPINEDRCMYWGTCFP